MRDIQICLAAFTVDKMFVCLFVFEIRASTICVRMLLWPEATQAVVNGLQILLC